MPTKESTSKVIEKMTNGHHTTEEIIEKIDNTKGAFDFAKTFDPEVHETAEEIKNWIEEKTDGKITAQDIYDVITAPVHDEEIEVTE
mmetsp:Transcript_9961/g.18705  ORF Transcript_9961/g.18705 Transcript_9961/m.18705 type:complete len:87 (+) Transcript_9961:58-318(+)